VASIAHRYRLTTHQVAQWNQVNASASFKPGQTVVVYLAGKAGGVSTGRKTAHVKTTRPPSPRTQLRAAKVSKAP
jgi:membrane-bound lytic murein transglycosylase D